MQVSNGEPAPSVDPQAPKPMATLAPGANPTTAPQIASAIVPAQPAASSATAPAPSASASAMNAGSDAPELVSGGQLLVEAYAAIWLIVLGLVIVMWRRTRSLEARLSVIDAAIAKAGGASKAPAAKADAKKATKAAPADSDATD